MKHTLQLVKKLIGVVILLVGLFVFLYPNGYEKHMQLQTKRITVAFEEQYRPNDTAEPSAESLAMRQEAEAYNQTIFTEKQSGMVDAWTLEQNPISFRISNDLFGYITVPAMDMTLPLYLGATAENMGNGAAVLGQTSLPIGGNNTNSVIVGHRGWHSGKFFLDIEQLAIGDEIYITNPWETLTYRAAEIKVIEPYDTDAITIQEGRDMVTLVTCHPYLSHGRYRYVVYCERVQTAQEAQPELKPVVSAVPVESSYTIIRAERYGRWAGAAIIVLILLKMLLRKRS